ncbi:MAG: restriction endonuclease [Anaerolineae bacterium]|nr:restriction endonuclease [Anaerolineae bacterium]MDQ7036256.1 restriction endonuclease [Anaerolineae bacterium]
MMNKAEFIENLIVQEFPQCQEYILNLPIIQYLYKKTRSVTRGSKARGSFGNLYAIYVLVEDYINNGFADTEDYDNYDGMQFTEAFKRQRDLPFGEKLQNHALNHRCNEEFKKYYPDLSSQLPIIRNSDTNRYWFNTYHLLAGCDGQQVNIAHFIIQIIDRYVELKQANFEAFFGTLENLAAQQDWQKLEDFIRSQLNPDVDARIFEIVSYCILRQVYEQEKVFFGSSIDQVTETHLRLFRTGRTNSNDGGIDFIMRPIGRIFQVTEVVDFKKYFLDIDKTNKYPITFVVKVRHTPNEVFEQIVKQAKRQYLDTKVRETYLNAFEEIITLPTLTTYLHAVIQSKHTPQLIADIIRQCKIEYNIPF